MGTDYTFDRIGERLTFPEREPELSADDYVRVEWVLDLTPAVVPLLDVGASDGSLLARWQATLPPDLSAIPIQAVAVEPHAGHRDALDRLRHVLVAHTIAEAILPIFRPQLFAVAWCAEVLEHLTDTAGPALLLQLRALSPRLIVTVPNRDCASVPKHRQRWMWPDHRRIYTARDLRADLEGSGWVIERLDPIVGATVDDSIWIGAVCS